MKQLSTNQQLIYLNNPDYENKDKYTYLKTLSQDKVEELYCDSLDLENHIISPLDKKKFSWKKYPLALRFLRNELDLREWEAKQ